MTEKFVCLNCEENKRLFLVDLDSSQRCVACGSDKVISASGFLAASASVTASTTAQAPKAKHAPSEAVAATHSSISAKQRRLDNLRDYYVPVRNFLDRNALHDLNLWWDGWSFNSEHSILPDDPAELTGEAELDWLRCTLKNANGDSKTFVCYFDPSEEARFSVSEIKRIKKN
jgi:hypothetical protein